MALGMLLAKNLATIVCVASGRCRILWSSLLEDISLP